MKHPVTGKSIVRDGLVLQHDYNLSSVEPLSSGAAYFDGTNDYIDCGDIGAAKSLAFWFKTSTNITSSSNYQRVFGFSSSYYGISLGASTGSLSGEVLTVLNDNSSRTATTTTFDSNTWYHACISWNASSNYFDVYINGVLSTDLSTGTHTLADWDSFIIGTDNTGGTHFGGYICNVGVWNAALSQAQVKSIMNKNYAGLSDSEKTDLVSWWNLDSVIPELTTAVYDNHHGGGETLGSELLPGIGGIVNAGGGIMTQISGNSYSSTSDGTAGSAIRPKLNLNPTAGKSYKLTITPTGSITGTILCKFYDGSSYLFDDYDFTTTKEIYFTDNGSVFIAFNGDVTFNIDSFTVSVEEINGNTGTLS